MECLYDTSKPEAPYRGIANGNISLEGRLSTGVEKTWRKKHSNRDVSLSGGRVLAYGAQPAIISGKFSACWQPCVP